MNDLPLLLTSESTFPQGVASEDGGEGLRRWGRAEEDPNYDFRISIRASEHALLGLVGPILLTLTCGQDAQWPIKHCRGEPWD